MKAHKTRLSSRSEFHTEKHQHGKILPYLLCLTESLVSSSGAAFPKDQSTNTRMKMRAAQRGQGGGVILLPPDFGNIYVHIHDLSSIISTITIYPGKQTHLFISSEMSI